jgi:NAD(P)-dependent dehydrogenase (short-subunit alcohol dehydrogenase family)
MQTNLKGKIVLITGAAKGIGQETAIAFGREGGSLALLDIDEAGLQETVEAVTAAGGRAKSFKATDPMKSRFDMAWVIVNENTIKKANNQLW